MFQPSREFLRLCLLLATIAANVAIAQDDSPYNQDAAGRNLIYQPSEQKGSLRDLVPSDRFGNAQGTQFDLAKDDAFSGLTVAVLHLYTGSGFDFAKPNEALREKGFQVVRWADDPPTPAELEQILAKSCQLWIISDQTQKLNADHLRVIKAFFERGHGLYIWGDNQPYYADANYVAAALLGTTMSGNTPGDEVVGLRVGGTAAGLTPRHLITTGLQYLYEGITIATIEQTAALRPLMHGSAGNLVAAYYDSDGRRAILDGGFTRLYHKWDTAGTGRYVKNAAAWLVNYERFKPKPAASQSSPKKTLRSVFDALEGSD